MANVPALVKLLMILCSSNGPEVSECGAYPNYTTRLALNIDQRTSPFIESSISLKAPDIRLECIQAAQVPTDLEDSAALTTDYSASDIQETAL